MPPDLPLRCQCGRMRGVARNVSPSTGFRFVCYCGDCQAFARFLDRADVLDPAGGTDIFHLPPARVKTHRGHGGAAMPLPLRQGVALVQRLLPDPGRQHSRAAGLPCHRRGAFIHGPRSRRSIPGRGARSAALPHLRTLRHQTAPAGRAPSTICRAFRTPRLNTARLVAARAQPPHAVLRRSHQGAARRAARAQGERARGTLTGA